MKVFRKKRAGIDPLMAWEWNQMVDIAKGLSKMNVAPPLRLLRSLHGNLLTIDSQASNWFIGRIHNDGPGAPGNYTDQRYWVKEQVITNSGEADTTDLTWGDYGSDNALWVTATNLAEVISQSHDFPDNSNHRVLVYRSFDASGVARYVFNSLAIVVD